ncbi:MAG: MGMT family protein [Candidatus Pacearchaeota archaeon]
MPEFYEKCYAVLKKVPKGKVTTYKEIARALNSKAYRAVGTAMNKNPYVPIVPCHRVVNSDGKVGEFFSGKDTKIKLLKSEGVYVLNGRLDLKKYFYKLK